MCTRWYTHRCYCTVFLVTIVVIYRLNSSVLKMILRVRTQKPFTQIRPFAF